jgi:hypothetical protein
LRTGPAVDEPLVCAPAGIGRPNLNCKAAGRYYQNQHRIPDFSRPDGTLKLNPLAIVDPGGKTIHTDWLGARERGCSQDAESALVDDGGEFTRVCFADDVEQSAGMDRRGEKGATLGLNINAG